MQLRIWSQLSGNKDMCKILFLALSLILCSLRSIHGLPWHNQNQPLFQRVSKIHCPMGTFLVNDGQGERCISRGNPRSRPMGNIKTNRRGFDFIFANNENKVDVEFANPSTTTPSTTTRTLSWEPQARRSENPFDLRQKLPVKEFYHHEAFGIALPQEDDYLSRAQMECLQKEQVYWPQERECFPLLQQGPCKDHEWLVMREKPNSVDEVEIHCQKRPCPCHAKDPLLCEVWYEDPNAAADCSNKCRVALAAEQDGICGSGEQLLLNPFGRAICGCRGDPVHMRSSLDYRCHPLGSQGPCPSNETLEFVPSLNKAVCLPTLCPTGMVLHSDSGRCFYLHTQGPCAQDSELVLDPESKQVTCHLRPGQVRKRVFDLAPSNPLRESRNRELLLGKLRVQMSDCSVNSNSIQCQDQDRTKKLEVRPMLVGLDEKMRMIQDRMREQETRARGFLRWLWSFNRQ
ncbi:hypothetical protein TCAL_14723 [Tigriopus californicus]|uniref:DUF4789 domain-containing protein n=1 Tax=Tigriopus californicus TaxID=6832 RepID=A0A553PGS4_TIGCA|nr:hypothetical protein TCAL_14723 [Tigriopus californicus]